MGFLSRQFKRGARGERREIPSGEKAIQSAISTVDACSHPGICPLTYVQSKQTPPNQNLRRLVEGVIVDFASPFGEIISV